MDTVSGHMLMIFVTVRYLSEIRFSEAEISRQRGLTGDCSQEQYLSGSKRSRTGASLVPQR